VAVVVAILLGAFALAFVLYPLYRGGIHSVNKEAPGIMNFHDQDRDCHAERSEASRRPSGETLRGVYPRAKLVLNEVNGRRAQGDTLLPTLNVKNHDRGATTRRVEHSASLLPGDITAQQADREESARAALQEVEFDYQLGNLGEDDYRSLRERYMRRALSALKSRHERERELDDAIEEQVRKLRETEN